MAPGLLLDNGGIYLEQFCITIPCNKGEPVRRRLMELDVLDRSLKIFTKDGRLHMPVIRQLTSGELAELSEEVLHVKDIFESQAPILKVEDLLGFAVAYEIVGDIALIEEESEDIAAAILKVHRNVNVVLCAISAVEGEYRTRRFRVVAGEQRTRTVHKDHGFRYNVDLAKAYFTPRLSTERQRIVSRVGPDDVVIDMFAGVGPYSIPISFRCKKVIAMDKNPDAIRFLKENVELNKVNNIEVLEGDANELALGFEGLGDHIIMNLPHSADAFLDAAVYMCAPGGVIHFYAMTPEDDLYDSSLEAISRAAKKASRTTEVMECRIVRSYAPHQYNVCIEVKVGN